MSRSRPEPGDWSNAAELAELQRAQLPRVLAQALRSPFYAARYEGRDAPRTAEDFTGVEPTTKQDLRDQYPFGMFAVPRSEVRRIHASSGTTGRPTVVGYTEGDLSTWADVVARSIRAAGG